MKCERVFESRYLSNLANCRRIFGVEAYSLIRINTVGGSPTEYAVDSPFVKFNFLTNWVRAAYNDHNTVGISTCNIQT